MRLRTNIASPLLLDCLYKIMANKAFDEFYLVGGTALALQRGHKISIDIDMFIDALYGEMKMDEIKKALVEMFPCRRHSILLRERTFWSPSNKAVCLRHSLLLKRFTVL